MENKILYKILLLNDKKEIFHTIDVLESEKNTIGLGIKGEGFLHRNSPFRATPDAIMRVNVSDDIKETWKLFIDENNNPVKYISDITCDFRIIRV